MQGSELSDPSRDRNVQGDSVPLMRNNTKVEEGNCISVYEYDIAGAWILQPIALWIWDD